MRERKVNLMKSLPTFYKNYDILQNLLLETLTIQMKNFFSENTQTSRY